MHFMFNPTEYTITQANTWNLAANKSGNVPKWEFGGGEPRQLQLELFFDSYLPRQGVQETNVRKVTNQLFNFMMIDSELKNKNPKSKILGPPVAPVPLLEPPAFVWDLPDVFPHWLPLPGPGAGDQRRTSNKHRSLTGGINHECT